MYYTKRSKLTFKHLCILGVLSISIYLGLIILLEYDFFKIGLNMIFLVIIISITLLLHKKVESEKKYFTTLIFLIVISNFILTLYNLIVYIVLLFMIHTKNKDFDTQKSWEEHIK